MAEKSKRRLMLEASLAEDPTDAFLRYGLALQCLRDGDVLEGRERLIGLIQEPTRRPDRRVSAAWPVLSRSRRGGLARSTLETGIAKARKHGDWHAAEEMGGLLASLG